MITGHPGVFNKEKGWSPEDASRGKDMLTIHKQRSLFNIEDLLFRGEREVFTALVDVGPSIASQLLERNDDNRPIRWKGPKRTVEAYAAAMSRGEWMLNGETIIVSKDGLPNDGQHRLHAILKSGVTVPMLITFGVDRDTRHTVDQGSNRTPGNILSMLGEKNTNKLAAAVKFVWAYDGAKNFGATPTSEQLLHALQENGGLRDALRSLDALSREFSVSNGSLAGAFYVCHREFPDRAEEFLDGVTSGLNLTDRNSPIFRLRKRYQDHASKRDALQAVEQAALFIKAFNLFRKNKPATLLVWRRFGANSEEFPVVGG